MPRTRTDRGWICERRDGRREELVRFDRLTPAERQVFDAGIGTSPAGRAISPWDFVIFREGRAEAIEYGRSPLSQFGP